MNEWNKFNDYFTNEELARIGLLTLKGDRFEFVHRSFAEYFFNRYLITKVDDERVQKLLLENILLDMNNELICQFFNDQIEKHWKCFDRIQLTDVAIKSLPTNIWPKNGLLFSVIIENGYHGICRFFLKSIQHHRELHRNLLTKKNDFNMSYLDVAIYRKQHKVVQVLLDECLKVEPEIIRNNVMKLGGNYDTPLIKAATIGSIEIVEILLNFIKNHRCFFGDGFLSAFLLQTNFLDRNALSSAMVKVRNNDTSIVDAILQSVREYPDIRKEWMLQTDFEGETVLLKLIDDETVNLFGMDKIREIIAILTENINDSEHFEVLAVLSVYGSWCKRKRSANVDGLLNVVYQNSFHAFMIL